MNDKTMQFQIPKEPDREMREALQNVYNSLKEKGYNPINQIVGYILSEDPTYITNHNNARAIITKIDKYELMRALVQNFIQM
ncbi:MAG: IreB family regulatory phosphoprotein [Clostridia bacterium]|nr:IreB family regulatory phosphoprotein [Clostridia bacterium]